MRLGAGRGFAARAGGWEVPPGRRDLLGAGRTWGDRALCLTRRERTDARSRPAGGTYVASYFLPPLPASFLAASAFLASVAAAAPAAGAAPSAPSSPSSFFFFFFFMASL